MLTRSLKPPSSQNAYQLGDAVKYEITCVVGAFTETETGAQGKSRTQRSFEQRR